MKRFAIALLVTAAALAASSARAHTNVSIGVRFGTPAVVPAPVVIPAAPVFAAPAPAYCPPPVAPVYYAPARGYWKDVTVKTWVPERWFMSRDRWGRPVRVCEPGYYTYRTDRVWVDGRHDRGHHYGWNR